jgi:colanic acid/amylovoran biosynthesis protein
MKKDREATLVAGEPAKIGLIGASFETGNMGVGALAAGSIRCIHTRWPRAKIFILDYSKCPSIHSLRVSGKELDVELLNIRFSKSLYLANNIAMLLALAAILRALPSRWLRELLLSRNATLAQIWQTDMFASIAGGDSFSDIYGLRRFLYIALPQILVVVAGKRLVLLPQTFGPFRSRFARTVTRFITRNADSTYARDYESLELVTALQGVSGNCEKPAFRYDVAFALEPVAPSRISTEASFDVTRRNIVGLNVSGLLYMGGYTRGNMFNLKVDYRQLIARILDLLIRNQGASVLLIPHVFGNDERSESDVVACREVYRTFAALYGANLGLLEGEYDQGELKHIIGKCDFFIGSRMHACIAAISQCVPAAAIAYSDKFIGVMKSVGVPSVVVDPRHLNLDETVSCIDALYLGREKLRMDLQASIPSVVRDAVHPFHDDSPIAVMPEALRFEIVRP